MIAAPLAHLAKQQGDDVVVAAVLGELPKIDPSNPTPAQLALADLVRSIDAADTEGILAASELLRAAGRPLEANSCASYL